MRCHVFDALTGAGRAMRRALSGKADLRHPRLSANRRRRTGRPAGRAGRAVRAGLSSRAAGRRAGGDGGRLCRREPRRGRGSPPARWSIAAGAGAFGPNRPPLAGIEAFEGRASSTWCGGARISAAAGWSSPAAAIRRSTGRCRWPRSPSGSWSCIAAPRFRAAPQSAARLQQLADAGRIELVIPYQLHALEGAGGAAVGGHRRRSRRRHAAPRGRLPAAVFRPGDRSRAARRAGASTLDHNHIARRPGDLRHLAPGHLRDRRHRRLSRQAQADPVRLCRGGAGGARDPPAGPPRRGAAFRIFDDEGRAGQLSPANLIRAGRTAGARHRRRRMAGVAGRPAGGSCTVGAGDPARIRSSPCRHAARSGS